MNPSFSPPPPLYSSTCIAHLLLPKSKKEAFMRLNTRSVQRVRPCSWGGRLHIIHKIACIPGRDRNVLIFRGVVRWTSGSYQTGRDINVNCYLLVLVLHQTTFSTIKKQRTLGAMGSGDQKRHEHTPCSRERGVNHRVPECLYEYEVREFRSYLAHTY
jgi:hypothetical protein